MKDFLFKKIINCVILLGILTRIPLIEANCNVTDSGNLLEELRTLMKNTGVDGYIIPMSDAHQSEYVSETDSRIKFLTNFTGSAGEAVITENEALFWTDNRYYQQADQQLELSCWKIMKSGLPDVPTIQDWLKNNLTKNNSKIGVDPLYMGSTKYQLYSSYLNQKDHELISVKENLIDKIWKNKPPTPNSKIFPLPTKYTGRTIGEKMELIRNTFKKR